MYRKNRQYNNNGHCDRAEPSVRKVQFSSFKPRKKKTNMLSMFENITTQGSDVDMMSGSGGGSMPHQQRKYKFQSRMRGGRHSAPPNPQFRQHQLNRTSTWFQVTIPYGAQHSKKYLMEAIGNYLHSELLPICYEVQGGSVVFYVDSFAVAKQLKDVHGKIMLTNGYTLKTYVRSGVMPQTAIDVDLKTKLAAVMAKRYIVQNKALDLTWFHRDPDLSDVFCPLSKLAILNVVLDIIKTNIPDIEALDLSNNFINNLESVADRLGQLKNLFILHVKNNNIYRLNCLNGLNKMNIKELALDGNPYKDRHPEKSLYISEVRKKFPKLVKLDSVELPPMLTFDVSEELNLPEPQAAFICHADGRNIVKAFLQQYIALYDSDNRIELAQAYHENASFSLSAWYPPNIIPCSNGAKLTPYLSDNRNLKRVTDYNRRQKLLFHGKMNIVKNLQLLPKTQHDLATFAVDLTIFTAHLLCLSVHGVFKELETEPAIRSFSRTFIIVPNGSGGFSITNDVLYVTNALDNQISNAFQTTNITVLQSPQAATAAATSTATAVSPTQQLDDNVKLQMVQTLSARTGMNIEWSKKCLDETNWEFDRAAWTFTELHKRGSVPPEAFVK